MYELAYAKVRELPIACAVERNRNRRMPVVDERASIDQILTVFTVFPLCRAIYVARDTGELCGIISIRTLQNFIPVTKSSLHITSRTRSREIARELANQIMEPVPFVLALDDRVGNILPKLVNNWGGDEIPVVNSAGTLVAVVSPLELLKFVRQVLISGTNISRDRRRISQHLKWDEVQAHSCRSPAEKLEAGQARSPAFPYGTGRVGFLSGGFRYLLRRCHNAGSWLGNTFRP